jgi:hypothetical protein
VVRQGQSVPLEDIETGKKSKSCRYFKMKALDTHKTDSIDQVIEDNVDKESVVFSDRANTYLNISDYVDTHMSEKSTKETTATTLKWVHIAISNAKRNLLGVYHKIKDLRLRGENIVFGY